MPVDDLGLKAVSATQTLEANPGLVAAGSDRGLLGHGVLYGAAQDLC